MFLNINDVIYCIIYIYNRKIIYFWKYIFYLKIIVYICQHICLTK